jgi:hypothetical protein
MTTIEKAHKLMKIFEEGSPLTDEELLYLYCIHFLYVKIGYRLPHTFLPAFYNENILIEIKERIEDQNYLHNPVYNQFNTEASALQYILTYEMDSTITS